MPTWGPIGYYAYTGRSDYPRSADYVHQADQQPLAVQRQLHAVADRERRAVAADQRPDAGAVHRWPPTWAASTGLAVTDQRHRAVFNGIWEVGYGFQVSGLYFFGSGQRQETVLRRRPARSAGCIPAVASLRQRHRDRPRNDFVQDPIHRVDMRLQQRIPLGRVSVDGMLELFNVFNRANFASYTLDRSSPVFGQPNASANISYAPRTMQMGFRVQFSSQDPTPNSQSIGSWAGMLGNRKWKLKGRAGKPTRPFAFALSSCPP